MGCASGGVTGHASLLAAYRKPSMARRALMISGAGPLNFMASAGEASAIAKLPWKRRCARVCNSSSPKRETLYERGYIRGGTGGVGLVVETTELRGGKEEDVGELIAGPRSFIAGGSDEGLAIDRMRPHLFLTAQPEQDL